MTVEEKRRELFEAWYVTDCLNVAQITITQQRISDLRGPHGDYRERAALHGKWVGFNAALDAVEIELPENKITFQTEERFNLRQSTIAQCRAAIESTGLGLKVKP